MYNAEEQEANQSSLSTLWECLWLSEECPLSVVPLRYLGLGIGALYAAFLLTAAFDVGFLGGLMRIQDAAVRKAAAVRKSLRAVQRSQRGLSSARQRVEVQLRRGKDSAELVAALRSAVTQGRLDLLEPLTARDRDCSDDDREYAASLWHTGD